jgi:predicted enzyme related to lactoylglutathione lyase
MPNAFVHIELNTDDVAKAKKFYKGLFKWKTPPWGDGYTGIDVGKGTGGGMQKKPMPGAPTMWLPYVEVDDVKKTVAKAKKLGANVQVDYQAVGDMGAIGVFIDPTGAPIGVWEKAKKRAKKARKS